MELLRHGDADDLAVVHVREVERVRAVAKDFRDAGRDECLQIVRDGLPSLRSALREVNQWIGWEGPTGVVESGMNE